MQQLTKGQIQQILTHYNIGTLTNYYSFWTGLANLSYQIKTIEGGQESDYVLRVYREGTTIQSEIEFEMAVLTHLKPKDIAVPEVVLTAQGEQILHLRLGDSERQVALFGYLPGTPMRYEDIDLNTFAALGEVLARLHHHLRDFKAHHHREVIDLRIDIKEIKNILPRQLSDNAVGLKGGVVKKFKKYWQASRGALDLLSDLLRPPLDYQVIHADLNHDNVLWEDGKMVGVLDFGLAAYGLPVLDIAITLGAWLKDAPHAGIVPAKAALLSSYQKEAQKLGQLPLSHFSVLDLLLYYYFWREMRWVLKKPENKEHQKNNIEVANKFLPRLEQLVELL